MKKRLQSVNHSKFTMLTPLLDFSQFENLAHSKFVLCDSVHSIEAKHNFIYEKKRTVCAAERFRELRAVFKVKQEQSFRRTLMLTLSGILSDEMKNVV